MKSQPRGKRLFSGVIAGTLMMGAVTPGSYAAGLEELQDQQTASIVDTISAEPAVQEPEATASVTAAVYADPVQAGGLLITELVPDTANFNKADAYEFVEVYNNTGSAVNFKDYYFFYNNKDNWKYDQDAVIPAHGSIVFWVMNGTNEELTADQFNTNFNVALQEGVNLFRINGGGGMANTAARNLQIRSRANDNTIISATYQKEQVKENKGIIFAYPSAGGTDMTLLPESGTIDATPGTVIPGQLPDNVPGEEQKPVIKHVPVASTDPADLAVQATVNLQTDGDAAAPAVELLYRTESQQRETVVTMTKESGDVYKAVIPAAAMEEPELHYSIRVKGSAESYSVHVNLPEYNNDAVPPLLITELLPNSSNVAGTSTDAFEFIEVYNNTDQPVDFINYKVYYRYPDKGAAADVKWPSTEESLIIPAQQSVVFWIINSANSAYTADDFNEAFQTNLALGTNLFQIKSDGMANSGRRAIVIKSNTEKDIASAYYDADTLYNGGTKGDETKENKALLYKYPVNGAEKMLKISSGAAVPTPGKAEAFQVPATPVHVEPDTVPPTVNDLTEVTEIDQSKGLELKAFADDDKDIKSVEVHIATDKKPEYVSYNLSQDYNDTLYHHKLSSADLIGRTEVRYYYTVSDGTNVTESRVYTVKITGGPDRSALRLNLKDDSLVSGKVTVKGTSATVKPEELALQIDSKAVDAADTYVSLENDAYFVFDAKNVDYYFKNGITMGPEELGDASILYTFMDPITSYTTLSFPIKAAALKSGPDNTIYIRAGSKSSPFDPRPEENKDDFEIKNVRLLLADGTEIWDPAYAERDKEIKMGDSAGKHESIGFQFNLNQELLESKSYDWDTTAWADGPHSLSLLQGGEKIESSVTVDNTAPVIQPNLKDGETYRGQFEMKADITDQYAGVSEVIVKLDGKAIMLPYQSSSGQLSAGAHTLQITAVDKAGNKADQTVQFKVPDENPLAPQLISPAQDATAAGTSPQLKVKVEDPAGDRMDVTYYKGFKYDGEHAEQGFSGYKNASDTEPPKQKEPAGEAALTSEEYSAISSADGQYLINDSVEQFPYQRYEIKLDESVSGTDRVDVEWKGNSLPGRKVSLYAWSPAAESWKLLDYKIAGDTDFTLSATVLAGDYNQNNSISVMVQDEIAHTDAPSTVTEDTYDYTFVWMSDTQYYSQSYPYIYEKNVQWIADNKDNLNVKYVIHTGDLVDKSYQEYQWKEADKNMRVLEDAGIPYGVLAGNHDVGHQTGDYTEFWKYFGEWRFKNLPGYGGTYKDNMGHYDLISAGGNDYLIVYMGWGLGDEEIDWMNEIVARYPERKAILALHEYLLVSNNRAPIADQIFEKVVKPNKNVIAALSGHYHDAELKVDQLDDNGDGVPDRNVYQMLADYQGAPEGGLGYIRLLQFDTAGNKLHVKTYSPYLDDYNYYDEPEYPGKDEFTLDLDLQPVTKRVATDYIGVKVYTDQEIAAQKDVASGSEVTAAWKALNPDSYYQWYVKAEDQHSGMVLSDIWGFYTGKQEIPVVTPKPDVTPTPGVTPAPEATPAPGSVTTPATPSPTATPAPAVQGSLTLEKNSEGVYTAGQDALSKLVEASANGEINLELSGAQTQAKLQLDASALKLAVSKQVALRIQAAGMELSIPAGSLPELSDGTQSVLLNVDTSLTVALKQAVLTAGGSTGEFKEPQAMIALELSTVSNGNPTAVHQLKGKVTVTIPLTGQQRSAIDSDYAGVYYLNNGQLEYMGGELKAGGFEFTTSHFSTFAVAEYHKQFSDTAGHWAESYISRLAAKHVATGVDAAHFQPQAGLTRADFAVLAIRALGLEAVGASTFTDVAANAYYAASVGKAAELGFIQGAGGKFRPQDQITREEAAVVLSRMLEYKAGAQAASAAPSFKDTADIAAWAVQAVGKLQAKGLLSGKADNRFDPQAGVTRAEMAKLLYSFMQL
ncbi:S-layer homology domain-containing protein [Paenibacillus typhae]|uniref:S-layer homology domain-containing protein n=1 Tax=Paenibacillus typhae TaxID=1174501 RepID=UPI001C8DBB8A|nr:S-layer homology domain-containing protein [Paenibacillus typhae]MBY0013433.1 S-layer homology domain-containing protein [Paenibacillus typhae]